jgi:uncharacterized SAM-binding protein YcdF (DUF218 family)
MPASVVIRGERPEENVRSRRWPRRLRRVALGLLLFCCLFSLFYFLRSPILAGLANLWIINDPPQKADAIILLGGGLETRPFAAAKLYRDGFAPRILVTHARSSPTDDLGLTTSEHSVARQVLLKEGVPDSAIEEIGQDVRNTHDEAVAVRDWASSNRAARLILPTDIFHTRRVRWVFHKQLKSIGVQVMVEAVPVREYQQSDWWRHEQGVVAFQNEVLKFAYYWVKY